MAFKRRRTWVTWTAVSFGGRPIATPLARAAATRLGAFTDEVTLEFRQSGHDVKEQATAALVVETPLSR